MSDNNSNTPAENAEPQEPTLDEFENEFFGKEPAAPVEEDVDGTPPSDEDNPEDTTGEDGDEGASDDPPANDDNDDGEKNEEPDEDDGEADPKPPKKNRAEDRIKELNAKYREEERQRIALEERLAKLEADRSDPNKEEGSEPEAKSEDAAPHWDDVDENGEKKYPLGQFDPQFNADLVRHTMQQERKAEQAKRAEREKQTEVERAEQELQANWEEKLEPARERYPDFQQKGEELVNQFTNLDAGYAKYLTQTIQSMDNGTDVFYHLASNPDLAQEIVRQGPAMASVALGRLSAEFDKGSESPAPKVSSAPPPPPTTRGSAPPRQKDILDNLDDFESAFFKNK